MGQFSEKLGKYFCTLVVSGGIEMDIYICIYRYIKILFNHTILTVSSLRGIRV